MSDETIDETVVEDTITEQEEGPQPAPKRKPKIRQTIAAGPEPAETKAQRSKRLMGERRKIEKELDEAHKKEKTVATKKKVSKSKTKSGRRKAPNAKLSDEQVKTWISKHSSLTRSGALKALRAEGYPIGSVRFFKAFESAARKSKPKAKPKKKAAA